MIQNECECNSRPVRKLYQTLGKFSDFEEHIYLYWPIRIVFKPNYLLVKDQIEYSLDSLYKFMFTTLPLQLFKRETFRGNLYIQSYSLQVCNGTGFNNSLTKHLYLKNQFEKNTKVPFFQWREVQFSFFDINVFINLEINISSQIMEYSDKVRDFNGQVGKEQPLGTIG